MTEHVDRDRWPRWLRTQAVLLLGILSLVVLLLVFGTLSMRDGMKFYREMQLQEELMAFRHDLDTVYSDFLEAGGDDRTYLLTGHPAQKEAFDLSARRLVRDLGHLLHDPEAGASTGEDLPGLSRAILHNLSRMEQEVSSPRLPKEKEARPWETIRPAIQALNQSLAVKISRIRVSREREQTRLVIVSLFFTSLILGVLFMGYAYLYRHNQGMHLLQAELSELASRDPLTGLSNRRHLLEVMEWALARMDRHPHACAVLYLDLDGFKGINDRLGHQAGDRLLVEFSLRLAARVRKSDLVSRLGGDEFVVFCDPLQNPEELPSLVQKILDRIEEAPLLTEKGGEFIKISSGWAIYPEDGKTAEDLLKVADQRMYDAKSRDKKKGPSRRKDPLDSP